MTTKQIINGKEESFQEAFDREYNECMKNVRKLTSNESEMLGFVNVKSTHKQRMEMKKILDTPTRKGKAPIQTPEQEAFNNDPDF